MANWWENEGTRAQGVAQLGGFTPSTSSTYASGGSESQVNPLSGLKDLYSLYDKGTQLASMLTGAAPSAATGLTAGGGTYLTGQGLAGTAGAINTTAGAAGAGTAGAGSLLSAAVPVLGAGAIAAILAKGFEDNPRTNIGVYTGAPIDGGNTINNELMSAYAGLSQPSGPSIFTGYAPQTITDGMGWAGKFSPSTNVMAPKDWRGNPITFDADSVNAGGIEGALNRVKYDEQQRGATQNEVMDTLKDKGLWSFQNKGARSEDFYTPFSTATTPFGDYSVSTDKNKYITKDIADSLTSTVANLDNQFASKLTPEQIGRVKGYLSGSWQESTGWQPGSGAGQSKALNNLLVDRYRAAFQALGMDEQAEKIRDAKFL